MGYAALRVMLRKKNITIGQVSRELGIDLNRLYNATACTTHSNIPHVLTLKEMVDIKNTYLPEKKWEDVFKEYDSSEHEFDTVFKSEAGSRRRY